MVAPCIAHYKGHQCTGWNKALVFCSTHHRLTNPPGLSDHSAGRCHTAAPQRVQRGRDDSRVSGGTRLAAQSSVLVPWERGLGCLWSVSHLGATVQTLKQGLPCNQRFAPSGLIG